MFLSARGTLQLLFPIAGARGTPPRRVLANPLTLSSGVGPAGTRCAMHHITPAMQLVSASPGAGSLVGWLPSLCHTKGAVLTTLHLRGPAARCWCWCRWKGRRRELAWEEADRRRREPPFPSFPCGPCGMIRGRHHTRSTLPAWNRISAVRCRSRQLDGHEPAETRRVARSRPFFCVLVILFPPPPPLERAVLG